MRESATITETHNENNFTEYRFTVIDSSVTLDAIVEYSRETSRKRKFNPTTVYARLTHLDYNYRPLPGNPEPEIAQSIIDKGVEAIRSQFVFKRWART
jgi:hypothetical protein